MNNETDKKLFSGSGHEQASKPDDPFTGLLHKIIRAAEKVL